MDWQENHWQSFLILAEITTPGKCVNKDTITVGAMVDRVDLLFEKAEDIRTLDS